MSTFSSAVRTAFLVVSALFLVSPSTGNALDLQAEIDPLAQQLLADEVAVGFVVGIYKDGEEQVIPYGETEKGKARRPTAIRSMKSVRSARHSRACCSPIWCCEAG